MCVNLAGPVERFKSWLGPIWGHNRPPSGNRVNPNRPVLFCRPAQNAMWCISKKDLATIVFLDQISWIVLSAFKFFVSTHFF